MNGADLIVEYYRRDLSPAEDDALAALLQASPAEAERFAALAAEEYRRFGLPEPPAAGRRARGLKWILLLLALGGAAAWAWQREPEKQAVLAISESEGGFEVVERRPATAPAVEAPVAAAALSPAETPRLWVSAQTPRGPFDIRVSGAQADEGSVHDAQGRRVAGLQGLDGPHFRWNGRDGQGRSVRAGAYQLRVQTDRGLLKQWVEIEVR